MSPSSVYRPINLLVILPLFLFALGFTTQAHSAGGADALAAQLWELTSPDAAHKSHLSLYYSCLRLLAPGSVGQTLRSPVEITGPISANWTYQIVRGEIADGPIDIKSPDELPIWGRNYGFIRTHSSQCGSHIALIAMRFLEEPTPNGIAGEKLMILLNSPAHLFLQRLVSISAFARTLEVDSSVKISFELGTEEERLIDESLNTPFEYSRPLNERWFRELYNRFVAIQNLGSIRTVKVTVDFIGPEGGRVGTAFHFVRRSDGSLTEYQQPVPRLDLQNAQDPVVTRWMAHLLAENLNLHASPAQWAAFWKETVDFLKAAPEAPRSGDTHR